MRQTSKYDFSANVEASSKRFGSRFAGIATYHRLFEGVFGNQKLPGKTVACNFDLLGIADKTSNIAILRRVYFEQAMVGRDPSETTAEALAARFNVSREVIFRRLRKTLDRA